VLELLPTGAGTSYYCGHSREPGLAGTNRITRVGVMAHSVEPVSVLLPTARNWGSVLWTTPGNQGWCFGPHQRTMAGAMAHSGEQVMVL
jgi:hypothetical protein